MKYFIHGLFILALSFTSLANTEISEEQQYQQWAKSIWDSLDRQQGEVLLENAGAKLNIPSDFYFLNSKDSATVLEEVWGNPPGGQTLGMLFPSHLTPFDSGSWAVTIDYEEDGYVSDKDAKDIDYSELLDAMQADTREASQYRTEQGYPGIELVGWAAQPFYDETSNKLHWAKEIRFDDRELNTLNYNIRVLGRKGVLVLNFIAGMDQKSLIESQLDSVLNIASFDQGAQYGDFNPDIDEVAAYGIGALVAGKVIAKTGLFAAALIFFKKFGVVIILGLGALAKTLWGRRKKAQQQNSIEASSEEKTESDKAA